jgi:hypothetical protein
MMEPHSKEPAMSNSNGPGNGNFAALVEEKSMLVMAALPEAHPNPALIHAGEAPSPADGHVHQCLEDVLINGEEPTEELLQSLKDTAQLPPLTEEELEQQALAAGASL